MIERTQREDINKPFGRNCASKLVHSILNLLHKGIALDNLVAVCDSEDDGSNVANNNQREDSRKRSRVLNLWI